MLNQIKLARLIVIAALVFMALRPAQAAGSKLPEHMIGTWCEATFVSTKAERVFFRPERVGRQHCSDMTDGVTISPEGFENDHPMDDPFSYRFDKIEQIDSDTYLIHIRYTETRKDENITSPEYPPIAEFKISNGLLFIKGIPGERAAASSKAAEEDWWFHFRRCTVEHHPSGDALIMLKLDDVRQIQKLIPHLKSCEKFWQCTRWRDGDDPLPRGKSRPKHCYAPKDYAE